MIRIAHTIINVSDFEKSRAFYDALMATLGVDSREVHNDDAGKIVAYQIPGSPLYIRWSGDEEKKDFVRNVGLDHICIGVDSEKEVDDAFKVISEFGVVVTREPKKMPEYTDNYYAFYFRDPDGIPLEIAFI